MSLIQRTPGPYRVNGVANQYVMATGTDGVPVIIAKATHHVNAEFIAHACNAHDKLVASLSAMLREFSGYETDEGASVPAITAIREARVALGTVQS